jgi:hypothetical protein
VANGWMQNPIASDFNFETMRMEKEEQTYKGRFEEEGHQTFNGQRRTEDIAHIVRIVSAVDPCGQRLDAEPDRIGFQL